jgi:hypothetical protein
MSRSGENLPEVQLSGIQVDTDPGGQERAALVPIRVHLRVGDGPAKPRTGLIPRQYVPQLRGLLEKAEASSGKPCRLEARVVSGASAGTGGQLALTVRAQPAFGDEATGRVPSEQLAELVSAAATLKKLARDVEATKGVHQRSEEECTPA